jgi:hypothetical protein
MLRRSPLPPHQPRVSGSPENGQRRRQRAMGANIPYFFRGPKGRVKRGLSQGQPGKPSWAWPGLIVAIINFLSVQFESIQVIQIF